MKRIYIFGILLAAMIAAAGSAKAQEPNTPVVIRLDPALDELISTDAKLETVKSGFAFTEGPNWIQHGHGGYLLFSDIPADVVYKLTSDGKLSVYLDRSGYTGPFNGFTVLAVGGSTTSGPFVQLGSDGLTVDREGRLIICAFGDRALERLEKDGKRTVLADRYEGKRFNGPNDVVVKKDGAIYFSDTFSALRDRPNAPKSADKGLDYMAIFMIRNGKLTLLINDMPSTNGLAFSPDEKYLYVNGSGDNYIKRYEVQPDDTLTNGRPLIDLKTDKTPGITDGMRVDSKGNIYSSGPGGVWIISPEGKHLGTILTPATNLTFGDSDWKTLYIAAPKSIYKIRVNTPGLPCNSCSSKD
jgi:gluconolactonase